MSTLFRPILASGVILGVVPEDQNAELKTAYETELAELDSAVELEGSCEQMTLELTMYNPDEDEINRNQNAERHRRVLKRWKEFLAREGADS